ncbi:MAG TPA: penicillin-binding protein 2 [Bdellovibrionales bacterium]|nr:penicillin-binding protein 2 [Bdellovibrionales bacterium]
MKARLVLVFFLIFGLIGGILLRAAYVQILPNQKLAQLQSRQFKGVVELQPRRGVIFDRNGVELATSVAAHSLYADPHLIQSPKAVARKLSRRLGMSPETIYQKIKDPKKRFVWLRRRLDAEVREEIQAWKIEGLAFVEESKRIYPNESLLSSVLGFVGHEGQGLEGLEARLEQPLRGETRKIAVRRDARGRPLVVNGQLFSEQPDGSDVTLTIDSNLQYNLEQELLEGLRRHRAQSAVGIILDVKTSEILAMSSLPDFNPNNPAGGEPFEKRNRAVTDPFEPGSTLKTFTLAAALKEGTIAPNTRIFCENGKYKIGKRTIGESIGHKYGWLTAHEILAHSSNIGTAKIALELGGEKLRQTFTDFGFGVKSGVDTLGESRGILPPLPWRDHLLANISFGHGVAATPLQIANAYAAIANGGTLRKPFLVKSIRSKESGEEQTFEPDEGKRVIDSKIASTLSLMLMGTTGADGTGVRARVNGFPVAGKTGTAQKLGPDGRYMHAYISSFAGFVPANDPRFVIYIAYDDPREKYYGSEVAAPVFARVAGHAVRESGLAPTLINEDNLLKRSAEAKPLQELEPAVRGTTDEWKGLTLRQALTRLRGETVSIQIRGRGRVKSLSRSQDNVVIELN